MAGGSLTDREIELLNAEPPWTAGIPAANVGRRVTSDTVNYTTVVSVTVSAGQQGDLHEVSFFSDDFTETQFRLTIAGVQNFTDLVIGTSLSLPWRANRLAAGDVILLEARSVTGVSVTVDGAITLSQRAT